jgi:hypothetical protein
VQWARASGPNAARAVNSQMDRVEARALKAAVDAMSRLPMSNEVPYLARLTKGLLLDGVSADAEAPRGGSILAASDRRRSPKALGEARRG